MPGMPGNDPKYDKQNWCPHNWEPEYDAEGNCVGSRCTLCGKYENYKVAYPTWEE